MATEVVTAMAMRRKKQAFKRKRCEKRFDRRVVLDPSSEMIKDAHALLRIASSSGRARERLILENLINTSCSGRVALPTFSRELKRIRQAMGVV